MGEKRKAAAKGMVRQGFRLTGALPKRRLPSIWKAPGGIAVEPGANNNPEIPEDRERG
jgi:hypothetical protein